MSRIGRTLATAVAVALSSWSCGSTAPDATPQVATIVVSPATSTLALNAQLPLQAQVQDGSGALVPDASVTWTVQDPKIVSVSAAGVVTGLAIGSSQVAANALGKSGIATITVTRTPVANVVLLPNTIDATVGSTTQLSAIGVRRIGECAHRSRDHLVEQQPGGRDREQQWTRHRCRSRDLHDHRGERRKDEHVDHHGRAGCSRERHRVAEPRHDGGRAVGAACALGARRR